MRRADRQVRPALLLAPLALAIAAIPAGAADADFTLEEIVVTAQKRTENISDVPISMTVDTGEMLAKKGINTLEGLAYQTPSLVIQDGGRVSSVAIRGLGSPGLDTVESSVGIYIDEIYFGRSRLSRNPVFDMDRVEVLRGPQGTLYGRNTIAGAISMHSARPTEETEGRIVAESGNLDSYKLEGFVSTPVTDTLGVRFAALAGHRGNYLDNSEGPDGGGQDTEAYRLSGTWDPIDTVSVFAKYEHMNHRNMGIYDQLVGDPFGVFANYPGIDLEKDLDQQVGGTGLQNIADSPGGYFASDTVALHVNWELGGGYALKSVTGWSEYDARSKDYITASPVDSLTINGLTERTEYWSQELRIESPEDKRFRFIAGVFADDYEIRTLPRANDYAALNLGGSVLPATVNGIATTPALGFLDALFGAGTQVAVANGFAAGTTESFRLITPSGSPDGSTSNLEQDIETWSAFFEGTYEITEKLHLIAGVRYTDETNEVHMAKGTWYTNGDGLPWGAFPAASQITATAIAADPSLAVVGTGLLDLIYGGTANSTIGPGLQFNDIPLLIAAAGGTPRANDETSEDQWIPSAKLQYFYDDNTMLYLTVASGFKAGGFNSSNINVYTRAGDSFESEEALAVELGAKLTLLDGAAQLNLALFRTDFDELQVATITTQGAVTVVNAAAAVTQGLEIDSTWRATKELTLGLNYAWLDAYYDDSVPLSCGGYQKKLRETAGEDFSTVPCTFMLDDQPSGDDALQRAPEHTGTLWGEYLAPLTDSWDLQVYGAVNYRDESSTGIDNYFYADSLTLLSGRIAVLNTPGRWSVAVFGNNLLDEDGNVLLQDNSGGAVKGMITTPRTYGLQLMKEF